ncbi:MAG TPA: hypothetical protein PKA31_00105 [Candidatus Moranbacteria bacterium]|nr:hypothetical protein [Candidatus Moranbacteria bacterium]
MQKEFSEQQRRNVIEEVGMSSIRNAIRKEGMLVFGNVICVNPRSAELWCKKKAIECHVPEIILLQIVKDLLKEMAKAEIEKI